MSQCSICGSVVRPGFKFCTKCGNPMSDNQNKGQLNKCSKCGNPLNPRMKFCTKCGQPVDANAILSKGEDKGIIGDFVRGGVNAVRNARRRNEISSLRQRAEALGLVVEKPRTNNNENSRNEVVSHRENNVDSTIEGVDFINGKGIWNINPGQIARCITEKELNLINKLKGIVIEEGCEALIYIDGELVGTLTGGMYTFAPQRNETVVEKNSESVKSTESSTLTKVENESFIKKGFNWLSRLLFGKKDGESQEKRQARHQKATIKLRQKTDMRVVRVYLVNKRVLTLLFDVEKISEDEIKFRPFTVSTKYVDVEMAVSAQFHIVDTREFIRNYLSERTSFSTYQLQKMLINDVQLCVRSSLRNFEYQQGGFPDAILNNLRTKLQAQINTRLFGIEVLQVLDITDSSEDFNRFRSIEKNLYCSEKEIDYLQRTNEFKNRLAAEVNAQEIAEARTAEELRYKLDLINNDSLLHDDEKAQFVSMIAAQRKIREATSEEQVYEALEDLKKNRLVKDDEIDILKDSIDRGKIDRTRIIEIMRIQSMCSIEEEQTKAEMFLADMRDSHRIETESRQLSHEINMQQQRDDYEFQKLMREEEIRRTQTDYNQNYEFQRNLNDVEILRQKQQIALDANLRMQEAERLAERQRSEFELSKQRLDAEAEQRRMEIESNMSHEQIVASHMKDIANLDANAQAKMAEMMGSGKLQAQQQEMYERMMAMQNENQQNLSQSHAEQQNQMMQMMQMMMSGMTQMGQNNMINQQQRYDDVARMKDEYRENMMHQQQRIDNTQDRSLNYTTERSMVNAMVQNSNNMQFADTKWCGNCGAKIPSDAHICSQCGAEQ